MCDRAHEELDPGRDVVALVDPRPGRDGHARGVRRSGGRPRRPHPPSSVTSPRRTDDNRIGINGFGRMGRLVVRALRHHPDLQLVHINELNGEAATAAHLLEFDTVHGRYHGTVVDRRSR